jgi:hypothetical protein
MDCLPTKLRLFVLAISSCPTCRRSRLAKDEVWCSAEDAPREAAPWRDITKSPQKNCLFQTAQRATCVASRRVIHSCCSALFVPEGERSAMEKSSFFALRHPSDVHRFVWTVFFKAPQSRSAKRLPKRSGELAETGRVLAQPQQAIHRKNAAGGDASSRSLQMPAAESTRRKANRTHLPLLQPRPTAQHAIVSIRSLIITRWRGAHDCVERDRWRKRHFRRIFNCA